MTTPASQLNAPTVLHPQLHPATDMSPPEMRFISVECREQRGVHGMAAMVPFVEVVAATPLDVGDDVSVMCILPARACVSGALSLRALQYHPSHTEDALPSTNTLRLRNDIEDILTDAVLDKLA